MAGAGWRSSLHLYQPFQRHRGAGRDDLLDRADRWFLAPWLPLLLAVRAPRHAGVAAVADPGDRAGFVPGPPVQPRAATVRGNDGRPPSPGSALQLRDLGVQLGLGRGRYRRRAQLRPDGLDLRAGNPRRGHPGLRFCAVDVAVHQRRGKPSLSLQF